MSKSLGNVVEPRELVEIFGLDQIRYFLLREKPFGADGSISHAAIISRINVDLANDLGNLAQRTLSLIARNCGGALPAHGARPPRTTPRCCAAAAALPDLMRENIDRQAFHDGLEEVWKVIRAANGYIDRQAPWALNKTDKARMGAVLRVLVDTHPGGRDAAAAVHARQHGPHARPARRAAGRPRTSPPWRRRWPTAPPCRRRRACSPATWSRRRDAPPDADRLATATSTTSRRWNCRTCWPAPPQAGVGEMVTIGTRMRAVRDAAGADRGACRTCGAPIGVHPHNAAEAPIPTPEALAAHDHATPRSSASANPAWTISTTRPRATCSRQFPRPYPRRAPGRRAAVHPCPRRRRRHRADPARGTRRRAATSTSCCTASAPAAAWPRRRWTWAAMSASPAS